MSKKQKYHDYGSENSTMENNPNSIVEEITEDTTIQPEEVVEVPSQIESNFITVSIEFQTHAQTVDYIVTGTNQKATMVAGGGELKLLQGRMYMVPVNVDKNINSDNYSSIKVFSDMAGLVEVKYVKDGFACIIPVIHNCVIKTGTRLCILW